MHSWLIIIVLIIMLLTECYTHWNIEMCIQYRFFPYLEDAAWFNQVYMCCTLFQKYWSLQCADIEFWKVKNKAMIWSCSDTHIRDCSILGVHIPTMALYNWCYNNQHWYTNIYIYIYIYMSVSVCDFCFGQKSVP